MPDRDDDTLVNVREDETRDERPPRKRLRGRERRVSSAIDKIVDEASTRGGDSDMRVALDSSLSFLRRHIEAETEKKCHEAFDVERKAFKAQIEGLRNENAVLRRKLSRAVGR